MILEIINTVLFYSVWAATVLLDAYALFVIVQDRRGVKSWKDRHPIVAPALSMLGVTILGLMVELIIWLWRILPA